MAVAPTEVCSGLVVAGHGPPCCIDQLTATPVGHRLIFVPFQELYGLSVEKVYGEVLEDLNKGLEVRSSLIATLFSRATGEVAVVDAIAISDNLVQPLEIRSLVTSESIDINVIHNRYKPLSPQALLFQELLIHRLKQYCNGVQTRAP